MATLRLIPSTYAVSNSSYLSVSNASNMYNNTDNTSSYATVTNSRQSTTSYYLYSDQSLVPGRGAGGGHRAHCQGVL